MENQILSFQQGSFLSLRTAHPSQLTHKGMLGTPGGRLRLLESINHLHCTSGNPQTTSHPLTQCPRQNLWLKASPSGPGTRTAAAGAGDGLYLLYTLLQPWLHMVEGKSLSTNQNGMEPSLCCRRNASIKWSEVTCQGPLLALAL